MSANIQPPPFTCPACGLLCDDIKLEPNICAKSIAFFSQGLGEINPTIKGKQVSLQEAVTAAAQILSNSQQPLFAGLSTDIAGFKAVYNLAQKTNGELQHMNAQSMTRNLKVLQSTGWQTTTLTEVKNRADLIVCIGTDIVSHNPRFFERFVDAEGMFVQARKVVFLGEKIPDVKSDALRAASSLACRAGDLPSALAALNALVLGKPLKASQVAGIPLSDLQALADEMKAAKYAVLAWVAKDLDFNHAELTIQQMTQIISTLNQTTRAAGLPLGGSDGDTSVNNVHTWRNGVFLEDALSANIHAGGSDAVIWVNSFSLDKLPPKNGLPLIVLGNVNSVFETPPDVFIPIATPALDCDGMLFRVDGSVILPLKKVQESHLPTLADMVRLIENVLK